MDNWISLALGELMVLFNGIFIGLSDIPFFVILLVSSLVYVAFMLVKKAKKASK